MDLYVLKYMIYKISYIKDLAKYHYAIINKAINTKKYHVFAPMGRFQLESIYLYFPPSSQLV